MHAGRAAPLLKHPDFYVNSKSVGSCLGWHTGALREDAYKIHRSYSSENLARVRYIALNYLKDEMNFKGSTRRKQKKAELDENYLAAIFAAQNVSCVLTG